MAIYNEVSSGGLKTKGCSIENFIEFFDTLFHSGDVLFNIHKAKRGFLEKVVLKRHFINSCHRKFGIIEIMYVDTLNAYWNESDLIERSLAESLVQSYFDRISYLADRSSRC